jgi:hypothetical protein
MSHALIRRSDQIAFIDRPIMMAYKQNAWHATVSKSGRVGTTDYHCISYLSVSDAIKGAYALIAETDMDLRYIYFDSVMMITAFSAIEGNPHVPRDIKSDIMDLKETVNFILSHHEPDIIFDASHGFWWFFNTTLRSLVEARSLLILDPHLLDDINHQIRHLRDTLQIKEDALSTV